MKKRFLVEIFGLDGVRVYCTYVVAPNEEIAIYFGETEYMSLPCHTLRYFTSTATEEELPNLRN